MVINQTFLILKPVPFYKEIQQVMCVWILGNNRLNDSAWLTVAEDKTNLFGLPLQKHASDEAYRFW